MSDRTVLITGATRGIGRELAAQLVRRGDRVVVTGRDLRAVERTAAELGESAVGVLLDVADPASVERAANDVADRTSGLDVVVNNAAVHYDTWQQASAPDMRVVDEAVATNLLGAWRVTVALLPMLRRSPHPRIVNVSSEAGSLASMGAGPPAYQVTKAALNALTITLAAELARAGVLVNAVCPGWVATDMGGRGGRPVADGAASILWAIDLPDNGPTGGFFRDGRRVAW